MFANLSELDYNRRMNKAIAMSNLLKLHEAIAVVLLYKEDKKEKCGVIADEINKRNLYLRKDGKPVPAYQIRQRTLLSGGKYHFLFSFQKPDIVKLK